MALQNVSANRTLLPLESNGSFDDTLLDRDRSFEDQAASLDRYNNCNKSTLPLLDSASCTLLPLELNSSLDSSLHRTGEARKSLQDGKKLPLSQPRNGDCENNNERTLPLAEPTFLDCENPRNISTPSLRVPGNRSLLLLESDGSFNSSLDRHDSFGVSHQTFEAWESLQYGTKLACPQPKSPACENGDNDYNKSTLRLPAPASRILLPCESNSSFNTSSGRDCPIDVGRPTCEARKSPPDNEGPLVSQPLSPDCRSDGTLTVNESNIRCGENTRASTSSAARAAGTVVDLPAGSPCRYTGGAITRAGPVNTSQTLVSSSLSKRQTTDVAPIHEPSTLPLASKDRTLVSPHISIALAINLATICSLVKTALTSTTAILNSVVAAKDTWTSPTQRSCHKLPGKLSRTTRAPQHLIPAMISAVCVR